MKPKSIDELHDCWTPVSQERSIANLRGNIGGAYIDWERSHFKGCWQVHGECALNELKKLERAKK